MTYENYTKNNVKLRIT